jgi:hypothetical protein
MSLDDFYLVSSGLAAVETTLFVYNKELYRNSGVTGRVYEPIRILTALRLANTGQQWADIFTKHNRSTTGLGFAKIAICVAVGNCKGIFSLA